MTTSTNAPTSWMYGVWMQMPPSEMFWMRWYRRTSLAVTSTYASTS